MLLCVVILLVLKILETLFFLNEVIKEDKSHIKF